jgi:hypothetical protein
MADTKLPAWLTVTPKGFYAVNTDVAYPLALSVITPEGKPDQYALEVAFQCTKMVVQELMEGRDDDPRKKDKALVIDMQASDKDTWAHRKHPRGKRDPLAATKGREARNYYAAVKAKLLA